MKIAYFINQYPMVSHSFIRREIRALEKHGVVVERFALRAKPEELVDPQDVEEFERTRYVLGSSYWGAVVAITRSFVVRPIGFLTALWSALRYGLRSDRGVLRHLIYHIEACILKKRLDEANVSHVHAHFGTNSAMVVLLCRIMGGPEYSFTVHGPEEFDKPEFISLGWKIRNSSFTIAVSSYAKSQLYRWVDYNSWHKIKVVRCGLEAEFYREAPLDGCKSSNIVCVGRLCEQKGQLLLIEALACLVREGCAAKLTLAGDGPLRARIEEMVARYQLEDHVTVTGWIDSEQVRNEILNARALVLPSFAEGLPVVIMEAMALARPVLSTYVAGIPELVIPKENGWLVPAGDREALVGAIQHVLNVPVKELEIMGQNARRRVLEFHSADNEARKLYDLFRNSSKKRLGASW